MKKNYAEHKILSITTGKLCNSREKVLLLSDCKEKDIRENGLFGIIPLYLFLVNLYIFVDFQTFYRCYFIRRLNVATENDQRLYF